MSRTNDLRKLIKGRLDKVCSNVSFEQASDDKMYPHIVFTYDYIDMGNINRNDMMVDIDIWDKSDSAAAIEDLADRVEDLFNAQNIPQDTILPTFYLVDRKIVPDEDKKIRHRLIRVQVQNYERRAL